MIRDQEHPYIPTLKRQLRESKASRREFLWTATMLGMSSAAAYAFADRVVSGLSRPAHAASSPSGTLRIAMPIDEVTRPFTIDSPQRSNLTRQVLDFLTRTGPDNITRPSLLSGWTPNEDLTSWTLTLRDDVKFHSGRKFAADDLIWNLQFALDEANGSSTVGLFTGTLLEQYEENGQKHTRLWDANAIEKVDDHTVRLNLKTPQLAIPEFLFHYGLPMMDPESNGIFGPGANGTGPFELVEFQPRRNAKFVARPDYWGEGPHLESFEFVDLGDDPNAAIGALAAGQIDGTYEADTAQYEALKQIPDLVLYTASTGATGLIRGKVTMAPWSDVRVRNALRRASNPEAAVAVALQGLGDPGEHHHVAPIHPEYAKLPPFKRDVEEAKRLLAEAGFPNGLDLELNVPAQYGYLVKMAEATVEHWQEAGIRVSLKLLPASQYAEAWSKAPFGITRWSHRPLGTMALALSYVSDAPWNDSEYKNADFDAALRKAQGTVDVEKRREHMAVIEKIMQEDGPVIQPIWKSIFTFMHKRVTNFKMHPTLYVFANELAVQA
ncbi:MAG: ABC transporter substrate-binding protein [Dongiaceae bacterium]